MDTFAADAAVCLPGDADHGTAAVGYVILQGPVVPDLHHKRGRDDAPEDDGEGAARGAPRRATTPVAEQDAEEEVEVEAADDFLPLDPAGKDDEHLTSPEEDFIPVDPAEDDDEEQLASREEDFIPIDQAEEEDDDGMITCMTVALGEPEMGDSIIPQLGLPDDDGQQRLASGQEEDFIHVDPDEDDDHAVYGHGGGVLFGSEEDDDLLSLDQIESEDIVYDAEFFDRLVRPALST